MQLKRILLPIMLPHDNPRLARQIAFVARHYHSQILLLHVLEPPGSALLMPPGGYTVSEYYTNLMTHARRELDQALRRELAGIDVMRLLYTGDPARQIVQTIQSEAVDLVAMSAHTQSAFYRLLIGSVVAKVLHHCECAFWADHYEESSPVLDFAIRKVLCAIDLSPHSAGTLSRAAQLAHEFAAELSIIHVTPPVQTYGPGGMQVMPQWKERFTSFATRAITQLQQQVGTNAEVIIDSGATSSALARAVAQAAGDILVIGRLPPGGHLGANGGGYRIIRDARIPVLSV